MNRNPLGKLYARLTPEQRQEALVHAVNRGDDEEAIRLSVAGLCPSQTSGMTLEEVTQIEFELLMEFKESILRRSREAIKVLREVVTTPVEEMKAYIETHRERFAVLERARREELRAQESLENSADSSQVGAKSRLTDQDENPDWLWRPQLPDHHVVSIYKKFDCIPYALLIPEILESIGPDLANKFLNSSWEPIRDTENATDATPTLANTSTESPDGMQRPAVP